MTSDGHTPAKLRRAPAERAARAVLPACAGAWTAAEIMHVTGIPWLDIAFGSTAAAVVAYGKGFRCTGAGILLAGGWTALAARLGPMAGPYWPVTDAWALMSVWGWRWACRHPAVTEARDRRLAMADWLGKRDRWGLPRTHLLDWEETRLGERYVVDVRGSGKRASAIAGPALAELIAENQPSVLPPGRVRVAKHRLAGRIEISIRHTDPWAQPVPHPLLDEDPEIDLSGPYSIRQPAVVGQDPETGRELELLLCGEAGGRNVNVVATLEAGKTTLLSCISERVTAARDALLFRVNLSIKGDTERNLWAPACHLTALGPKEGNRALKVLRVIAGIVQWRAGRPRDTANWAPSPSDPHLVLIIDEIDALTEIPACRQVLEHLASKGREFGVTIVRAGQRGTAEWTGGGNVRAVDGVFVIGKVNRSMEAMHAAGDLGLSLPSMAEYGEGKAGVWVIADLAAAGHAAGRGFNLSDPVGIREIVAERAPLQPDLQPELKAFLGETYEDLLSSDVYARWARDRQGRAPATAHPRPDMMPEPTARGVDPRNPLHALALAVRDGVVQADEETTATLGKALEIEEDATLAALGAELEDHLSALDETDPLRRRWLEQGRRNDETRRILAEAAAEPVPDIPHDDLVAHAEARWDELGAATEIPDGHREELMRLIAAGTTISAVAQALGVSRWVARTYLARLKADKLVQVTGKGRGARWITSAPPEEGDAQ